MYISFEFNYQRAKWIFSFFVEGAQLAHWSRYVLTFIAAAHVHRQWILIATVYRAEHSPINQRLYHSYFIARTRSRYRRYLFVVSRYTPLNPPRHTSRASRQLERDSREIVLIVVAPFLALPRVYEADAPRNDTFQILRVSWGKSCGYLHWYRVCTRSIFDAAFSLTSATRLVQSMASRENESPAFREFVKVFI